MSIEVPPYSTATKFSSKVTPTQNFLPDSLSPLSTPRHSPHRMPRSPIILLATILTASYAAGQTVVLLPHNSPLSGWHVVVDEQGQVPIDSQRYFVWEDSVLHVLPDAAAGSRQAFAALVTDSSYFAYILDLEYRWGEKKFAPRANDPRDAGVLFHVQESDDFWPTSLEYQIQEEDTGDIYLIGTRAVGLRSPNGKAYAPGGSPVQKAGERYARFARRDYPERPGWNEVRIVVTGQQAEYYLNGERVNALGLAEQPDGSGGWMALKSGRIALQAEGAEVYYRRVRLRQL